MIIFFALFLFPFLASNSFGAQRIANLNYIWKGECAPSWNFQMHRSLYFFFEKTMKTNFAGSSYYGPNFGYYEIFICPHQAGATETTGCVEELLNETNFRFVNVHTTEFWAIINDLTNQEAHFVSSGSFQWCIIDATDKMKNVLTKSRKIKQTIRISKLERIEMPRKCWQFRLKKGYGMSDDERREKDSSQVLRMKKDELEAQREHKLKEQKKRIKQLNEKIEKMQSTNESIDRQLDQINTKLTEMALDHKAKYQALKDKFDQKIPMKEYEAFEKSINMSGIQENEAKKKLNMENSEITKELNSSKTELENEISKEEEIGRDYDLEFKKLMENMGFGDTELKLKDPAEQINSLNKSSKRSKRMVTEENYGNVDQKVLEELKNSYSKSQEFVFKMAYAGLLPIGSIGVDTFVEKTIEITGKPKNLLLDMSLEESVKIGEKYGKNVFQKIASDSMEEFMGKLKDDGIGAENSCFDMFQKECKAIENRIYEVKNIDDASSSFVNKAGKMAKSSMEKIVEIGTKSGSKLAEIVRKHSKNAKNMWTNYQMTYGVGSIPSEAEKLKERHGDLRGKLQNKGIPNVLGEHEEAGQKRVVLEKSHSFP